MSDLNKPKLECKDFKYSSELLKFVNDPKHILEVVSITSKGDLGGEGYLLFYYSI